MTIKHNEDHIKEDEDCVTGYLYNSANLDQNTISKHIGLQVRHLKEEFATGDYNQHKGKPSVAGRIFASEDDARTEIERRPDSGYFKVRIPKGSITGMFADPLNSSISYLNVAEGTVPEVIELSTKTSRYDLKKSPHEIVRDQLTNVPQEQEVSSNHVVDSDLSLRNSLKIR